MTTVPILNSALRLGCLVCLWSATALGAGEPLPLDIGSRRELLVDDFLLDKFARTRFVHGRISFLGQSLSTAGVCR